MYNEMPLPSPLHDRVCIEKFALFLLKKSNMLSRFLQLLGHHQLLCPKHNQPDDTFSSDCEWHKSLS